MNCIIFHHQFSLKYFTLILLAEGWDSTICETESPAQSDICNLTTQHSRCRGCVIFSFRMEGFERTGIYCALSLVLSSAKNFMTHVNIGKFRKFNLILRLRTLKKNLTLQDERQISCLDELLTETSDVTGLAWTRQKPKPDYFLHTETQTRLFNINPNPNLWWN